MTKPTCSACNGTGVGSVTRVYHPTTGKVIRRIANPCRRCT